MKKAIVVSANPHRSYYGGSFIGRVLPHISHIRKYGGVLWNCGRYLPIEHNQIKTGYFYETNKGAITYQFDIIRFIDWSNEDEFYYFMEQFEKDDIEERDLEAKYIPDFRFSDVIAIKMEFDAGTRKGAFGILIKSIYPLQHPVDPRTLIKVSDNRPIQTPSAVQSYPIVYINPKIKGIKRELDPPSLIHTHIRKIIDDGKYNEKDIEDMLEYVLYDSELELVERQPIVKQGRIDILYKKGKTYYVLELKRGSADMNTLHQIQNYIRGVKTKYKSDTIIGIIICETASINLKDAVKKISNVDLKEFTFLINFGLDI